MSLNSKPNSGDSNQRRWIAVKFLFAPTSFASVSLTLLEAHWSRSMTFGWHIGTEIGSRWRWTSIADAGSGSAHTPHTRPETGAASFHSHRSAGRQSNNRHPTGSAD